MITENVLQPALVTQSAFTLATEVVRMILKIDDLVISARWEDDKKSFVWFVLV